MKTEIVDIYISRYKMTRLKAPPSKAETVWKIARGNYPQNYILYFLEDFRDIEYSL